MFSVGFKTNLKQKLNIKDIIFAVSNRFVLPIFKKINTKMLENNLCLYIIH